MPPIAATAGLAGDDKVEAWHERDQLASLYRDTNSASARSMLAVPLPLGLSVGRRPRFAAIKSVAAWVALPVAMTKMSA